MNKDFSYYLSHFLKEYLAIEKNTSSQTIRSYKEVFKQLIDFLVNKKNIKLININFKTITRETICDFLNYLEEEKGVSIRTRNQRLGAIKSFYQYCSIEEIDNFDNIKKVLSIKSKKYTKPIQNYLTEEEVKQLFDSIDTTTSIGKRNLLILVLLYDTAARASEIINLKIEDISLEKKQIILTGKGNKKRRVPMMDKTKELLIKYIQCNKITTGFLFQNKYRNNYNTRFIRDVIDSVSKKTDINKNITPHTFRRTRATHLLNAGINVVYIQELLGHQSIETTQEYAKVITDKKFEAIESSIPESIKNQKLPDWKDDKSLLNQLLNL